MFFLHTMSEHSRRQTKTELEKWNKSDIEIGDTFDINPYEYFLIISIDKDEYKGSIRDGIHVIGEQERASFNIEHILSQINSGEWSYVGNNSQLIPDET